MADIRIEKKEKGGSILPWLLGLLVAGLAIWGIAEAFDETEEALVDNDVETVTDYGTEIVENENPDGADTYKLIDFENESIGRDYFDLASDYETYTVNMTGEMGLDHEFSHNALNKLANATAALVQAHGMGADVNLQAEKKKILEAADYITKDPYDTDHADHIRMAAMSITSILSQVQQAKYPGYEGAIAEVRKAANDINKATLTLNQKEDVRDFFGKARVAVKGMRDYDVENRGLRTGGGLNTDPDNYDLED